MAMVQSIPASPPGSDLSMESLMEGLKWKLEHKSNDELDLLSWDRELQEIGRLIRQRLNSLRRINALPSEILTQIFLLTQSHNEYFPPLSFSEQKKANLNSWIPSTTHICSYWRQIALSSPILWTRLFLPRPPQQDVYGPEFLQRSGLYLPLEINLNLDTSVWNFTTRTAQWGHFVHQLKYDHNQRVRKLCINDALHARLPIWDLLADFDAPELECLFLDVSSGYNFPSPDSEMPRIFNRDSLPALKRLALKSVTNWTNTRFENLTHLWLGDQELGHRVQLETFLRNILQPCRNTLEYLALIDAGPLAPPSSSAPTAPHIQFPRLRTVVLDEKMMLGSGTGWESHLLLCMRLPGECMVHVTSHSPRMNAAGFVPLHLWGAHGDWSKITKVVIQPSPFGQRTSRTFCGGVLHVESLATLHRIISCIQIHLTEVTQIIVSPSFLGSNRITLVWDTILAAAPAVEEVYFSAGSDTYPLSHSSPAWKDIGEWLNKKASSQGFNGVSTRRLHLPPVEIPERRAADNQDLVGMLMGSQGDAVRVGDLVVTVGGEAPEIPTNPFETMVRRDRQLHPT